MPSRIRDASRATPLHESPVTTLETGIGSRKPVIGANISDGAHVGVTNSTGNSETELSASGSLATVVKGAKYGFYGPQGSTSDGLHVWVLNYRVGTKSELAAK